MTTFPLSHLDLDRETAVLATIGPDGYPQLSRLRFLFDKDGTIKTSLNTTGQKTKNPQAHPECTLLFLNQAYHFPTLEVRARAEILPDADYEFARKLGAHYGGIDFRTNDRPGETRVVVLFHPVKMNTFGE